MKAFDYIAIGAGGQTVTGRLNAESELKLDEQLEKDGLTLARAKPVKRQTGMRGARLSVDDLVSFTTQAATLLAAGVPVVRGLRGMAEHARTPEAKLVVTEIVRDLEAGGTLAEAFDNQSRSFPAVYRAAVRAGELSGALPEVLSRMASYLDWKRTIRATTMQALVYPGILCVAIVGLVITLLTFVLPRIIGMFPGGPEDLPVQTRVLIGMSDFMTTNAVALVAGFVVACGALVCGMKHERGRLLASRLVLRVPKLGHVAKMISVSKFASTSATLYGAGCDVYTVLKVSGEACGNASLSRRFANISESVRRGRTITESLRADGGMDPLLIQMADIGEQTGGLAQAFEQLAAYYDREVPRTVKWFLSFLEPAILVVAGVVVAFILVAALMPIFSLYENLG